MAENKIDRYGLGEEVLQLSAQPGWTGERIAEHLTAKLEHRDTISQSTVSRWLARVRAERASQTAVIVQEHLKAHVPADLKQIEEVQAFFYTIFKNQENAPEKIFLNEKGDPLVFELKARAEAGLKLAEIVFKKLKHAGLGDGDEDGQEDERGESALPKRSGIRGVVRSLRERGLSGPGPEGEIAGSA